MKAIGQTILLTFITAAAVLSLTAHAAPTISSVSVSGYLKRQSGSVVSNGTYASSIALSSGGVALSGCSDATATVVTSGYFSKQISCPALTMAAGTAGNITAGVSLTIGGTPESFTVTAYPVPTALVAGSAQTVDDGSIHNMKIAGTAAIALSKLNTAGATTGDVIRYDGSSWAYTGLGSLNISTTNANNNFTAPQAFSGGVNMGTATIGTSVVSNETVSGNSTIGGYQTVTGAGTFGSLAILNGVGITAGLAVGGSQTVGGYLAVTGTGTFGALVVSGNTSATNVTASGYVSAAAGTLGLLEIAHASNPFNANTGTGTINISNAATGTMGLALQNLAANGNIYLTASTININPTSKMRIGSNGSLSSMGACSWTGIVNAATTFQTCTGLPATTTVAVSCSPSATVTTASVGVGVVFRGSGTINSIGIRGSGTLATSTWNCMWMRP